VVVGGGSTIGGGPGEVVVVVGTGAGEVVVVVGALGIVVLGSAPDEEPIVLPAVRTVDGFLAGTFLVGVVVVVVVVVVAGGADVVVVVGTDGSCTGTATVVVVVPCCCEPAVCEAAGKVDCFVGSSRWDTRPMAAPTVARTTTTAAISHTLWR